jgi:hypothetical protein
MCLDHRQAPLCLALGYILVDPFVDTRVRVDAGRRMLVQVRVEGDGEEDQVLEIVLH